MSSLKHHFLYPFRGKSCLACLDCDVTATKTSFLEDFMTNPISLYFNSGIMVINVQKWIRDQVKEGAFRLLENEMRSPEYADQEALNVVLENDWECLDAHWNYPPHVSDYKNMPKIIHFMGYKPIYKDYKDLHKDTFYKFLENTKWANKDYGLIKKALIKGPYRIKSKLFKILIRFHTLGIKQ